jgi:hypothetical protein
MVMDIGGKIAMNGSSSNGQWQHNGRGDSGVITMGNEMAVAQWMAQWAADDCHQRRSGTMGQNGWQQQSRWMVVE